MAHLYLLDENGAVAQRWEIGDQPMAVGRDEAADVMVPDELLSRHHFRIWREGTDFLIKDLNSQNGTWVGGQRAQATKLLHNVCIVAGRSIGVTVAEFHVPSNRRRGSRWASCPETNTAPTATAAARPSAYRALPDMSPSDERAGTEARSITSCCV